MSVGPLPKTFRRMGSIYLLALCVSACCCDTKAYGIEFKDLSRQIELHVKELEYSEETAQNFIQMVNSWKDKQNKCVLAGWMENLSEPKEAHQQNKISKNQLAEIEENIAEELARKIREEITFNENFFDLPDIVKYRQTQCLGYTQLFYILGNSVGLSVNTINVAEMRTGTLPTGSAHTAGIVSLSNGKIITVDLVPNGFVSIPFTLEEQFEKTGDYWELKGKNNSLELDRKIQVLGKNELVAYIHNNRANICSKQGQYTQTISELNKAIEYHPRYAEAYYNRGIAYRHLDQLNQAVADYTKAIELNPKFAEAYTNRGIAYAASGQFNQAISDYTKAIELNPNFANAYYNRGIAYTRSGQFNQAIIDYDNTIKLNATLAAKAYGNRGISFAILGKPEEARKDLLKAAELNSELKEYAKAALDRFKLNANLN